MRRALDHDERALVLRHAETLRRVAADLDDADMARATTGLVDQAERERDILAGKVSPCR